MNDHTTSDERLLASRGAFERVIAAHVAAQPAPAPILAAPALKEAIDADRNADFTVDITVCIRVRPLLPDEENAGHYSAVAAINPSLHVFAPKLKYNGQLTANTTTVNADVVFGPDDETEKVFAATTLGLIPVALGGGVGTFLAYGQTGSGKTHTLTGVERCVARDIFNLAKEYRLLQDPSTPVSDDADFTIKLSFFELFGNQAYDLLNDRATVDILEDTFGAIQIKNITEEIIQTTEHFQSLITKASSLRRTKATAKNRQSSRSHAICRIRITNRRLPHMEDGMLYLIDLAGSEGSGDTKHHDKERILESKEINKSLQALKECIRSRALAATTTGKHVHVPYRTSKITVLLKNAFELSSAKQSRTVIVGTLAPSILDASQTVNTLRFMGPLKVTPSLKRRAKSNDPDDPATWDNATLRGWVSRAYPKVNPDILCPTESGRQICRLPEGEFLERCLQCEDVTPKKAKAFYLRLWGLLIDARTKDRVMKLSQRPGKLEAQMREMEDLEIMARSAG